MMNDTKRPLQASDGAPLRKDEQDMPHTSSEIPPLANGSLSSVRMSPSEWHVLLSERYVLQLTPEEDELLDPIERTVRYLIPIPKHYYWDVVKSLSGDDQTTIAPTSIAIPWSIRIWHHTIASCDAFGRVTNDYVGQPLASLLGLTRPRFFEVIESMTAEEMDASARRVRARQEDDHALRQSNAPLSA
jgi:hypothetical protein